MFKNPIPVVICLLPIEGNQLVGVRRGIEPRKGFVSLPGGYINCNEIWQQACCRELLEETGVSCHPNEIRLFSVESAIDSNCILLFGLAPKIVKEQLDLKFKNDETQEITLIEKDQELAFHLHTLVAQRYFEQLF